MINYFALPGLKGPDLVRYLGNIPVMRACDIPDGAIIRIGNVDRVAMRHRNGLLVVRHLSGGSDRVYFMPRSREWIAIGEGMIRPRRCSRRRYRLAGYKAVTNQSTI